MPLAAIEEALGGKPSELKPGSNWATLILDATCVPDDLAACRSPQGHRVSRLHDCYCGFDPDGAVAVGMLLAGAGSRGAHATALFRSGRSWRSITQA